MRLTTVLRRLLGVIQMHVKWVYRRKLNAGFGGS